MADPQALTHPADNAGTGGQTPAGPRRASAWRTAAGVVALDRPVLMGVLNATPDSFWHQSRLDGPERALHQAEAMLEGGAAILDVGGESTRPGAEPVPPGEERRRVVPVVEALVTRFPGVPVSVDTVKGETARAALEAGAAAVNDVSGLRLDPTVAEAVRDAGAGLILMHSRGTVADMATYRLATYGPDVVGEVMAELEASLASARERGVGADAIALDPGLGFSKTTVHSVAVLRELERFAALGHALVVGPSRKRFVGELAGGLPPELRLPGTIASCVVAYLRGARILRVHDVVEVRRALDVAVAMVDENDL